MLIWTFFLFMYMEFASNVCPRHSVTHWHQRFRRALYDLEGLFKRYNNFKSRASHTCAHHMQLLAFHSSYANTVSCSCCTRQAVSNPRTSGSQRTPPRSLRRWSVRSRMRPLWRKWPLWRWWILRELGAGKQFYWTLFWLWGICSIYGNSSVICTPAFGQFSCTNLPTCMYTFQFK
jgi:hypothetical protein